MQRNYTKIISVSTISINVFKSVVKIREKLFLAESFKIRMLQNL